MKDGPASAQVETGLQFIITGLDALPEIQDGRATVLTVQTILAGAQLAGIRLYEYLPPEDLVRPALGALMRAIGQAQDRDRSLLPQQSLCLPLIDAADELIMIFGDVPHGLRSMVSLRRMRNEVVRHCDIYWQASLSGSAAS